MRKSFIAFIVSVCLSISAVSVNASGTSLSEVQTNKTATEDNKDSEEKNQELETTIEKLQAEKKQLQKENEELQKKVEQQEQELTELQKKTEELEEKIEALNGDGEKTEEATEDEAGNETSPEITGTVYEDRMTVKTVQAALNAAGYNCGTPDGIAGQKTKEALLAYQKEKKINENGVITDELLEVLGVSEEIKKAAENEAAKSQYDQGCTYDQLARNPDTYKLKKFRISGKVLQTGDSGSTKYLRLAMDSDYDKVIFVTYGSDVLSYRLLDDDMVVVYGESLGLYSYEAVSGATITIPWLNADIIEMQ